MEPLKIAATSRTPEIDFDFSANRFLVKGESYPEDVTAFYGPVVGKLRSHFAELAGSTVEFTFELIYFNSSSAKVLMELFESLDAVAADENEVRVVWICEEDDENMREMGKEFAEDLTQAEFRLEIRDGG